jgi:ribonuclease VapC
LILDTSAVVAVFFQEPGFEQLLAKISDASVVAIGAPTLVEAGLVLSARLGQDARGLLARFLMESSVTVVPFGEPHFSAAMEAWLRYGKGRHEANLNFGDCLAFGAAVVTDYPLLCVGKDFAATDLALA